MTPGDVGRLLRTLRHLRPAQLWGQLQRPLRGGDRPRRAQGPPARLRSGAPRTAFLPPAAHTRASRPGAVSLLHRTLSFGASLDWNHAAEGPLFAFHLHYGDWIRAAGFAPDERAALLLDWVRGHRAGVGWHPATISARAFVWAKLLRTPGALPRSPALEGALAGSLADQLATLAPRLERDLLGNHYLFNLLALVLGGVLLEGAESERWLAFERALRGELAEQILPDGAHFERSPMYHALVLESVLDLLNVAAAAPGRLAPATDRVLRDVAARMLGAHAVWTHPDGEIALFSDSAFGIAARPAELADYAGRLGLTAQGPATAGLLDCAGYARLAAGPFSLVASVAGPLPPYQPGHAHCDALSFELSVGEERIVTDSGVYEYAGPRREISRATRSHATVQIDGEEQAELWGAHRVGGRPRVELLSFEPCRKVEASCRGWSRPTVLVRRAFQLEPAALRLRDRISGAASTAVWRLPLAPGLVPELSGHRARLRVPGGPSLVLELPEAVRWRVEEAPSFPEFGREERRSCLVGEARGPLDAETCLRIEG